MQENSETNMKKLTRDDLWSLEEYAARRSEFRARVMAHKKNRRVNIGPHLSLYFEDRLTIQYQVQEMLRIERIFDAAGIDDELEAYNPLIPDGSNWKATFMIEFPDPQERDAMLRRLTDIEHRVWMQIGDSDRIEPFADEDLERSNDKKTSAVHFLRFELTSEMIKDLKQGSAISAGIDHDAYRYSLTPVARNIQASLIKDLD